MGLYNNVPTFTYVSATGITVTYNEEIYTVQSFYTNKKYIYWDSDNATVLQASNTMPTRSFKRHLVLINDNGIVNEVPSTDENFSISYAGDSDEAVKSKIYALYEKNKEFGDKFVAIEQDIDGIKQIVGSGGSGDSGNEVIDRVSKLEQTAEKIELSVEEVKKTYSDDKEMSLLREELNASIINLNTAIGTLSSEMSEYYKDDKITNEEKIAIDNNIALINYNKSEMLRQVNKVILICESGGQNENLNILNSGVTALENAHTNLVQNITVAISDSIITNSEKTVIIDGFAKYNLRINELKNTCDDIIFLGIGGILSEQLAQMTMKSNEIKLSVHKVESTFTSDLSLQKIELEGQIKDVSSSLGIFKDTVETTFKDGIIDEAEKKILSEKLDQLEKEKLDIDSQYDNVYNSEFLTEPYNQNLKIEYDNYCSKHLELKNKIVEVIGFGSVTDADHLNVKTLFNEYSSLLASLNVCLSNSLDIISTSKANAEILKAKGELIKELEEANSKIDDVINNIDDFIGDGVVDSAEKRAIELSLQNLEKEKVDVEAQYNYWYSNTYLVDPLKSNYKRSYDNYISKYNHSVSVIEGIINQEGLVSDQNKQDMLNAHRELATSLVAFVEKTNEVIEFVSLKQSEAIKNALQGDIDDINHKLQGLDDIVSGTFEDNIIDQTERKILTQNLLDLELQKTDVVNQYEQLYKSTYLDGTLKEAFRTSYNNFISKYNVLVDTINLILDKTDFVNDTDRENVSNAKSNLNIAFGDFIKKSNEVIEYISKKQSSESIGNFDSELKDLNNKVDNILSDVGGALSDDVLDKAERMILESSLNDLEIQKNDVVTQYENLFNNENLTDNTIKENLKNSYNDFISKYNVLVNQIRYLLDKSGNITEDNRTAYQTAYNEYKASATTFTENFYIANDFITNKVMNDMKDSFNAEIRDVNNAINNLDETMNGIFKDGILSEAEKLSIKQQLAVLEREKLDVDNNHNNVHSNQNLSSSLKNNLKTSYDSYISSYNSLISIINTILNKTGIISSSEQIAYKNALNNYKTALGSYSSMLQRAIDNITSNKIESTKADIEREIGDVISSINDLENNMNEIFKDGVLSEAEKTTIRQQLQILYKEKGDVDKQYTALYSNAFLVDSSTAKPKSELKTAYDNFVSKYNALVLVIDEILKKTTIVDNSDRTKLENALSAYRTASSNYTTKAMNAIDAISSKKAQDESNKVNEKYADIILGEDGIVNKVGKIEKVSSTNADGIKKLTERVDKAELKIEPDAIIATVSQTIKESVDNISVGGRNYIHYGKGDVKKGFFKNFNKVENGYGEHTLTSQKQYSNVNIASGFVLGCRDYEVGRQVTFSYEIMYTNWNFPSGTNRSEFWIGQRYTNSSTSTDGQWRFVTGHSLPVVGENGCELNKWFKVKKTLTIPKQAHSSIGTASSIQFYNSNADVSASITFRIRNVKIEYGNKASDYSPAPEDVNSDINSVDGKVTSLQGTVNTTSSKVATLEANLSSITQRVSSTESTTSSLSTQINGVSSTAANALNTANSANALADSKAKIFTTTPTTPYKVGDLWVQGTSGDVMRCKTARTSGSYTASDWEKASKYTDDTKANAVDGKVTTLQAEYNKTKTQVAEIVTDLDGITQRVSSTESTTTTLTTKVNNVESTANTAKSTADSAKTTATNAQSTANTANSNATSALNKANDANSKVDNLEIGGRNLMPNTGYHKGTEGWGIWNNANSMSVVQGRTSSTKALQIKLANQAGSGYQTPVIPCVGNKKYTVSFWIKSSVACNVGDLLKFRDANGNETNPITMIKKSIPANAWTYYTVTFTTPSTAVQMYTTPRVDPAVGTPTVQLTEYKLEESTKASSWSPAPEDVQSQIDAHTTQITSTNSKVSSIETNLSNITSRVSNVETTATTVKNDLANLNVGGRNLIQNSAPNTTSGWSASTNWTLSLVDCTSAPNGKAIRATNSNNATSGGLHKQPVGGKAKLIDGETYTVSAWIRASKSCKARFCQETMTSTATIDLTTSWKHYKFTSKININATYNSNVVYVTSDTISNGMWIEVHSFKLEKGNKATDWSEAPEEISGSITSLTSRVSTAESKITEDAITNTVKKNFYTKSETDNQITSKGYQTASQVQQTVNGLEVKVSQSGGYNLLYNGDFKRRLECWEPDSDHWKYGEDEWTPSGRYVACIGDLNVSRTVYANNPMRLDRNAEAYTLSYWINTSTSGVDGTTNPYRRAELTVYYDDGSASWHSAGNQTKFATWEKHVVTVRKPPNKGFSHFSLGLWCRDTTKKVHYSMVMVEKGVMANEWSPNPNEVYDGVTTIDRDGIKVISSNSNTYTEMDASSFRVSDNNGGTVAEFARTSKIPNLSAGIISANEIYANNIVRKSTYVKNYYVAGGYGNDVSGAGGSWSNPCKTVQYVLDNYVEDILDYDVNIYVGQSVPGWTCKSKSGKGVITFLIQDDCIVRDPLYLDNCTNRVEVHGTDAKKGTFMTGIVVTGCHNFDIGWVSFRGKNWAHNSGSCNVLIRNGSKGIVRLNDFNGCSYAIIVDNNSELWVYGNRGSDITHYIGIGAYTTIYGMRSGSDWCPDFTGHYYADAGHSNLYHIHDGANYTKTPSIGWSPSYTPSQKTQTWSFNKIWSDETLHGWSDRQELIQGYATTWNTGRWTGYMQMTDGMAGIRNAISGGTNLSGRIYVQRTSSSGNSTGSKLCLYASDGTLITNSTSINRSQGVWVSLSSAIIQKIQSGAITYFYLKADTNNSATYFKCESNAKIEITYTN